MCSIDEKKEEDYNNNDIWKSAPNEVVQSTSAGFTDKRKGKRMALRVIRTEGDEILTKVSREVQEITPKIEHLIDDMFDTMYESNGCGLAAVQIGVLKRIFVVDVTGEDPMVFINPMIVKKSGSQTGDEGCLSVPMKVGVVTRPNYVKVRAFDRNMKEFEVEGTELLARAICHEYDHLNGELYVDKVQGELREVSYEEGE